MLSIFLNKQESHVISLSKADNIEEMLNWKIPNVLFPLIVIGVSLVAYCILTPSEKFEWLSFFNLLVNGSILMSAFNRMSSMISYYSKIEFGESKKMGINLKNLRMKIFLYIIFLVLGIAIFYSYQVIYKPFKYPGIIFLQLVISALFFWFSIDATKIAFLLQEALLSNTYAINFKREMESLNQMPPDNDIKF